MGYYLNPEDVIDIYQRETVKPYFVDKTEMLSELIPLVEQKGSYISVTNNRICAKSLDNRIGCYQLLEALKENDGTCPNDIYYVFCVQEELGCRGSKTAAARIRPDIGVAVDITPAHDYPCDLEGSNAVDAGIGIKICDPSVVCDEDVVEAMFACCEQNGIRYQREVIDQGGTDASSMQSAGGSFENKCDSVRRMCYSVLEEPFRFLHIGVSKGYHKVAEGE